MKNASGVNFTNIIWAAFFTRAIPKSAKKTDGSTVFFALLGSALVKAAHKTLMKLTPIGHRDSELIECFADVSFKKKIASLYFFLFNYLMNQDLVK